MLTADCPGLRVIQQPARDDTELVIAPARPAGAEGGGLPQTRPGPPPPLHRRHTEPTITYLISLLKSCSVIGDYEWLGFPPIPPPPSPQHPLPSFILLSPD